MALLRRRRQGQEPTAPRQDDAAPKAVDPATSPSDWVPDIKRPERSRSESSPEQWMPEGVASPPTMHRRSSPTNVVPPEATAAAAAAADAKATAAPPASAPPASAPPPASEPTDRDELHARIADLERQIAAARGSESTEQNATIRMLQTRLASLEEELRSSPPGYVPPGGRAATTARILAIIIMFLVIAGSPLFLSRRTICHVHGKPQTHWAVVKPFDASGPSGCDNQLGGSVLLDSLGLE